MVRVSYQFRHPKGDDLYTPMTPEVYGLLEQMYHEWENNWRLVAWKGDIRLKVLRKLRQGQVKAVSMKRLDRLITGTGVGDLRDFPWFTADDLVAMGIWKSPWYVAGDRRFKRKAQGLPPSNETPEG